MNCNYDKEERFDSDTLRALGEHYEAILKLLGEDPAREGLLKTPERVAKAMCFLTKGYDEDPREILLSAKFKEEYRQMVIVKDIELYSLCEHHMLPFYGKAHVAYIPNGYITGLSKIARVVEAYARADPRLHSEGAQPARRGRRHRGEPYVHADARRREAEFEYDDLGFYRRLPHSDADPGRIHPSDQVLISRSAVSR